MKFTHLPFLLLILTLTPSLCDLLKLPFSIETSPTNFLSMPSPATVNNFEGLYKAKIQLGSHNTDFTILLETKSSAFWIPDSSSPASIPTKFECSKSKTCQSNSTENVTLAYLTGKITGHPANDHVSIGSLSIPKYDMILAQNISSNLTSSNGILGLGLRRYNPNIPTFIEALQANQLISNQVFSVYLPGASQSETGTMAGEIIFGGYNPKYTTKAPFKFTTYQDKEGSSYSILNLQALGYGSTTNVSETPNIPTVIDLGSPYIYLPKAFIQNFVQQALTKTPFTYHQEKGLYSCSCLAKQVLQDLVLYLDGINVTISPNSYISAGSASTLCYLNMKALGQEVTISEPAVIGGPLFQEYYVMFSAENKTIGFTKIPVYSSPLSVSSVLLIVLLGAVVIIGTVWYCTREKGLKIGFARHVDEGIAIGGTSGGRNYARMEDNQEPAARL